MFAAMNPSGVAAPHSAHGQPSQLPKVVAIPVHGGNFVSTGADPQFVAVEGALCSGVGHSHSSKSLIHASTSAARVKQRTSSACTAEAAGPPAINTDSLRLSASHNAPPLSSSPLCR